MKTKYLLLILAAMFVWINLCPIAFADDDVKFEFKPKSGLWYNKNKPGHGIDFELDDSTLAAVWYTYEQDGTPVWYLAVAPFSGNHTWSAPLNKYHWEGGAAVPSVVGTITVNFLNRTSGTFQWTLNGQSGNESIVKYNMDDVDTDHDTDYDTDHDVDSNTNHDTDHDTDHDVDHDTDHTGTHVSLTGLWYNSEESGYGYSVDTESDKVAVVSYFYDDKGEPRWAVSYSNTAPIFSDDDMPTLIFFGPCPNCQDTSFRAVKAGTLHKSFSDRFHGIISLDIDLDDPIKCSWSKSGNQVILLTDPVDD